VDGADEGIGNEVSGLRRTRFTPASQVFRQVMWSRKWEALQVQQPVGASDYGRGIPRRLLF